MTGQAQGMCEILPDLGERTEAQLRELFNNPTPERCRLLAVQISGIHSHLMRLASELESGRAT